MTNEDNSPINRLAKFELSDVSQETFEKDESEIGAHLTKSRQVKIQELVPNISIVNVNPNQKQSE